MDRSSLMSGKRSATRLGFPKDVLQDLLARDPMAFRIGLDFDRCHSLEFGEAKFYKFWMMLCRSLNRYANEVEIVLVPEYGTRTKDPKLHTHGVISGPRVNLGMECRDEMERIWKKLTDGTGKVYFAETTDPDWWGYGYCVKDYALTRTFYHFK